MIVAVPSLTPVTTPSPFTVARFLLEELHVRPLRAVDGDSSAFSCSVSPQLSVTVPFCASATPVGLYGSTTLTFTVAFLPLAVFTVIVAVPSLTPITTPFASTVARFLLDELHVSADDASAGSKCVVSCTGLSMYTVTVLF